MPQTRDTISDSTVTLQIITPGGHVISQAEEECTIEPVRRALARNDDEGAANALATSTGCRCTVERRIQTTATPPKDRQ